MQVPPVDPAPFMAWESAGIVTILVAAIFYSLLLSFWILRQFTQGSWWTNLRATGEISKRDDEIADLKDIIAQKDLVEEEMRRQIAEQHREAVRLTDEMRSITTGLIGAIMGKLER